MRTADMAGDAAHADRGDLVWNRGIGAGFRGVAALAKRHGLAREGALVGRIAVGLFVQGSAPFLGDFAMAREAGSVLGGSV